MSTSPTQSQSELELDPGITPSRKPRSGWKFVLWIGFVIFILSVLYFIALNGGHIIELTRFAHTSVYQNQTWEEVLASGNRDAVVRPLINENQTFDVAITVWMRRTGEEIEQRERQREMNPLTDVLKDLSPSISVSESLENRYYLMGYEEDDIYEKPIFSDVVFHGLTLKDKDIKTKVELQIPTEIFRSPKLSESDLRASVVLIPTSPSPLDFISHYSTWVPPKVKWPRMKAYPFPLNTLNIPNRKLQDRAAEAFAMSFTLLSFQDLPGKCDKTAADVADDIFGASQQDELRGGPDYFGVTHHLPTYRMSEDMSNKHPFVTTRSQIRVSDETHIFNRKDLKASSCGQDQPNITPQLWLCERHYMVNGNWETLLQGHMPDGPNESADWFYAPYMTYLASGAGPKDLEPVPVTRKVCSDSTALDEKQIDQDTMNVTWHVSFSGRSPGKLLMGELWNIPASLKHDDSDWKKESDHSRAELINGLLGHRFDPEAHPRRRLALNTAVSCLSVLATILDLSYWITRTSTVHISVKGTLLLASSYLLDSVVDVVVKIRQDNIQLSHWFSLVALLIKTLIFQWILPLLMIRTAGRLVFLNTDGLSSWIPRRAKANHQERASARADVKTDTRLVIGILVGLVLIYLLFDPYNVFLISPLQSLPTYEDLPEPIIRILVSPLAWTGKLCQMALNERSKVFAGSYRLTVFVQIIEKVLQLALLSERVIGRHSLRWGLCVQDAIDMVILAGLGWQAVRLSRHTTENGGEEDSL
ncbi:hypothetical protein VNI00_000184 [Paramarasmius palmivorus]|uniref:Uncharacterized protein n=1 Tax=Paramarasmius palmivorus TaxID=297713 RepID=A0AAW0EC44_9AGAR